MRARTAVILATVLMLLLGGGIYLAITRFSEHLSLAPDCEAHTNAGIVHLNAAQMANAATITAVGIRRKVPDRAIVVALATALQESKLENLASGDRDSVGLFQQRPSQGWGTPTQLGDPRYAAGKFYSALLRVRGWEQMRVTDAAQRVQRSAFPQAYEKWGDEAGVLTDALGGQTASAITCTRVGDPANRGADAAAALGAGLRLDWGDTAHVVTSNVERLTVSAGTERAGWQFAHWLVAHSAGQGVARVQFGGQEWSADNGKWRRITDDSTVTGQVGAAAAQPASVVAEVYHR